MPACDCCRVWFPDSHAAILCGNPHRPGPLHNGGANTRLVANAGAVAPPPFPRVTRRVSAAFEHGLWPPRRRSRGRSVATARPPPPMHSLRPSRARTFWIDINVSPHAAPTGVRFNTCWITGIIRHAARPSCGNPHESQPAVAHCAPYPLRVGFIKIRAPASWLLDLSPIPMSPTFMAPGRTPPSRHDKWAQEGWPTRPPC